MDGGGDRGVQLFQLSFGGGGGSGCLEFFCEVVDGGQEKGRKIKEDGRDDADTDRDIDREIIYCPINSTIKWSFLHRKER